MRKVELNDLDRLQRMDHDTLIRLEAKVDQVVSDIKEMKDGTTTKMVDHETRIKSLESNVQVIQPETSIKQLREMVEWKSNFQFTWRFIVGASGTVGAIIGALMSIAVNYFGAKHG